MALAAAKLLQADRVRVRVVSMPSWELFAAQPEAYRDEVLPPAVRVRLGIEAASPFGWERWVGDRRRHARHGGLRCLRAGRPPVRGVQVHARRAPRRSSGSCSPGGPHDRHAIPTNPLVRLGELGQSPWYDFITRDLVDLRRAGPADPRGRAPGHDLEPDDLREGDRGQPALRRRHPRRGGRGPEPAGDLRGLAVADVRAACDVFAPVYEASGGGDGLVSLEVSPTLAHDTAATIHEAERLWRAVDRPNVMIKIPGTPEGLPAITHCIAAGINVNVTLLFSVERYGEVIDAFLAGLERRLEAGLPLQPDRIGRELLREPGGRQGGPAARPAAAIPAKLRGRDRHRQRLRGVPAVRVVAGHAALGPAGQGRRPTRSGRSGPPPAPRIRAIPDVYYVEALIAPRTVNTLPPETFAAYRDHGQPAVRIRRGHEPRRRASSQALADLGIDLARDHRRARGRRRRASSRRPTRRCSRASRPRPARWRPADAVAPPRLSLTWWIFIGMVVGILIGWLAPDVARTLKPLSTIFLRMIKSIVVPIIFGTPGHRHRRPRRRPQADRPPGAQVDRLLLADDDASRWPSGSSPSTSPAGRRRGPAGARPQRADPQGRAHHVRRIPGAHRARKLLRRGGAATRCCRSSSGPRSSPSR